MAPVYKSKEYIEAENILDLSKHVVVHSYTGIPNFELLVSQYNTLASTINDDEVLPIVDAFSKSVDVSSDGFVSEISADGEKKLRFIIMNCKRYVELNTPIEPKIVKVEGWSSKKFWGLTGAILSLCCAVCFGLYQLGKDIGVNSVAYDYQNKMKEFERQKGAAVDSLTLLISKFREHSGKFIYTDTIKIVQTDTVNIIRKDTIRDTIKIIENVSVNQKEHNAISKIEACVLKEDLKSINPEYVGVDDYLRSVVMRYKKFAKDDAKEIISRCDYLGGAGGTLSKCGKEVYKTIDGELEVFIRANKLKCGVGK